MPVKFKDYYETLGVARDATQDEIRKAFRKLARRYHPDVTKGEEAEEKFKEINEANEVLSDPEKRKRYNSLGSRWQAGQEFRPPQGFEGGTFHFGGAHDLGGLGDFSDFFNVLFGEHLGGFQGAHPGSTSSFGERGRDREAEIHVSLEEAFHGAKKKIEFETRPRAAGSRSESQRKAYEVAIPKGVIDGSKIRLSGQGEAGFGGAPSGDLYLVVRLIPHSRFEVQGHDLKTTLRISPWEAALGADLSVRTPGGSVTMKVPAATGSGQTFRLRGRGLPHRRGEPGDLFVTVQITVPKRLSPREKELFEELARISEFEPER